MTVVALAQITGRVGELEHNREQCRAAVRQAAAQGADLVVLPELIVPGYTLDRSVLSAAAEPLDGPTVAQWQALARETGALIVGGLAEVGPDRPFNTAVGVSSDGVFLHYRKLHRFAQEKDVFAPGDLGLPVVDTPLGRLGICICYDLRFLEVVRVLGLRGAEIVCVPSAWVAGFDASEDKRTHGCSQSDAAEVQANLNQVFLACASQAGPGEGWTFLGSSLVIDPRGKPRVGPRGRNETWIGTCEIDPEEVLRATDRGGGITPRDDRRTDVYGLRYLDEIL